MTADDVKVDHEAMEQARSQYDDATSKLHRSVALALEDGVRAVEIAEACAVTRGRVYQWARMAKPTA